MACKSGRSYDSHTYSSMRNFSYRRCLLSVCLSLSNEGYKKRRSEWTITLDRHRGKETGANIPKSDMAYNKSIHKLIR